MLLQFAPNLIFTVMLAGPVSSGQFVSWTVSFRGDVTDSQPLETLDVTFLYPSSA